MKTTLAVALSVLFFCCHLRAEDPAAAEGILKKLLSAEIADDYDAFVADGTDTLKAALGKTQFEASSNLLSAKLKGGYESAFLGVLNQKGYEVYLYRLHFKEGGDDILATLSLKDGKVGGIYFH